MHFHFCASFHKRAVLGFVKISDHCTRLRKDVLLILWLPTEGNDKL